MSGFLKFLGIIFLGLIVFAVVVNRNDANETERTGMDTLTRADLRECTSDWLNDTHPLPSDTGFSAEETKKLFYAICMGQKKAQRELTFGSSK